MLRLVDHDGLICPIFECDVCGKQIVKQGNVYWRRDHDDDRAYSPFFYAHKDPCDRVVDELLEQRYPGWARLWRDLETFVQQVTFNLEHDLSEAL